MNTHILEAIKEIFDDIATRLELARDAEIAHNIQDALGKERKKDKAFKKCGLSSKTLSNFKQYTDNTASGKHLPRRATVDVILWWMKTRTEEKNWPDKSDLLLRIEALRRTALGSPTHGQVISSSGVQINDGDEVALFPSHREAYEQLRQELASSKGSIMSAVVIQGDDRVSEALLTTILMYAQPWNEQPALVLYIPDRVVAMGNGVNESDTAHCWVGTNLTGIWRKFATAGLLEVRSYRASITNTALEITFADDRKITLFGHNLIRRTYRHWELSKNHESTPYGYRLELPDHGLVIVARSPSGAARDGSHSPVFDLMTSTVNALQRTVEDVSVPWGKHARPLDRPPATLAFRRFHVMEPPVAKWEEPYLEPLTFAVGAFAGMKSIAWAVLHLEASKDYYSTYDRKDETIARLNLRLGLAYRELFDREHAEDVEQQAYLDKAEECLEQALKHWSHKNDPHGQRFLERAIAHDRCAMVAQLRGQYEIAKYHYRRLREALEGNEGDEVDRMVAWADVNLAFLFLDQTGYTALASADDQSVRLQLLHSLAGFRRLDDYAALWHIVACAGCYAVSRKQYTHADVYLKYVPRGDARDSVGPTYFVFVDRARRTSQEWNPAGAQTASLDFMNSSQAEIVDHVEKWLKSLEEPAAA